MTKFFNLCKPGTNEVVIGPLAGGSAYIRLYPSVKQGPQPDLLEVGEHCVAEYHLSGNKGVYWIVRIQ